MNGERLLLFAHGSRDPVWLETFHNLARKLGSELGHDRIAIAFMEFAEPTLLDALAEASEEGVSTIKLLPLFLSAGGHVSRDIPSMVDSARIRFPDLEIELLPPIGEYRSFGSLVSWIARSALNGSAVGRPGSLSG
jgi:sirohydrochlorin cobaltochelatase